MNTKQLRQKILDMAIKGLLVPQDINDEPASKLLERIREEKEQLIKEGKLKRDKNESFIFVGDDKLHYEKFSDGTVVCIEDEIPFEIPDNWAWCRGKEIFKGLKSTKPSNVFFKYIDIDAIDNKLHCIKEPKIIETKNAPSRASRYLETGDTLFSLVRPYLENVAYISEDYSDCIGSTGFYVCSPYSNLYSEYIYILMITKYVIDGLNHFMKGDNSPSISSNDIEEFLYPLPPQPEQKRITDTVEELLKLVDKIEQDKLDLKDLVKQTKAKVLDLAIKGKLVPQDDNDEPADKLLEKIREEKEKLIKEGKLKRDKNESYIYKNSADNSYYEKIGDKVVCIDEDLPFEIPDSWRWCRLNNISRTIPSKNYQILQSEILKYGSYPVISQSLNIIEGYSFDTSKLLKINNPLIIFGDHTKIVKYVNFDFIVGADGVKIIRPILLSEKYLYYLLKYASFKIYNRGYARHYQLLLLLYLPIPPLSEQQRIVNKIEQIFEQLDNIENMLKASF